MKTGLLLSLLLLFSFSSLRAQDKHFHQIGLNATLAFLPAFEKNSFGSVDQFFMLSGNLHYCYRYNILEMSDNQAIGLGATAYLGLGISGFRESETIGLGDFGIPIEISYNLGLGSTYNSTGNFGISFKTGIDIFGAPLLKDRDQFSDDFKFIHTPLFVGLGIRYWRKASFVNELFIQYSFIKNDEKFDEEENITKALLVKVGYRRFLGY